MAASSRHTGWRHDENNSRLDMYYRGTRVGHMDGCGMRIANGALAIEAVAGCDGLRVNQIVPFDACSLVLDDATEVSGELTLSGNWNFVVSGSGSSFALAGFQLLCACATDIFSASSCSEPCSAAKGVVWAWQGDACATAPCGSAFLMITDDGCV